MSSETLLKTVAQLLFLFTFYTASELSEHWGSMYDAPEFRLDYLVSCMNNWTMCVERATKYLHKNASTFIYYYLLFNFEICWNSLLRRDKTWIYPSLVLHPLSPYSITIFILLYSLTAGIPRAQTNRPMPSH